MPDDQNDLNKSNAPAPLASNTPAKQPEKKFMDVPDDESTLPSKPWSVNPNCKNNLLDRYGPIGGQVMYRRVALQHGHFDPPSEGPSYRPDLEEGDQIGEKL